VNADPDSDIAHEARRWVVAQDDGPLPAREQRRLDQWLAADPAHAAAYETSRALFADLAGLQSLRAYARLPARPPSPRARLGRWWRDAAGPTRMGWSLGAAVASLALVAALGWPLVHTTTDTYHTAIGETRKLTLSDDSHIDLGPASTLRVTYAHGRRQAFLDDGEAFFSVAKQQGRPFFVDAGQAQVRVVGTQFNVRRDPSSVRIAVKEGVVQVGATPDQAAVTLRRGQDVVERDGTFHEGRIDAALAGGWRAGRVYYDGATLAEVVADARRYSARPIAFASPEAAGLRVTASFRVQGYETFITGLPEVVPVRVTTGPDGGLLIAMAAGKAS
jgi:transmembrane sensor